jgi:hypothetical protein
MTEVKPTKTRKIFVSFIEEGWQGQIVAHMGRVEVERRRDTYPSEEIRFATNDPDWHKFRERWDFRYVSEKELEYIRQEIGREFNRQ